MQNSPNNRFWHMHPAAVARQLSTDITAGLPAQEASLRLKSYGPNQLKEKKGRSGLNIFVDQFKNFIVWILVAAAFISGFLKEWVDALAIFAIVILNALLGFIQEFRAERSLAALKKLSSPNSRVIRGGSRMVVASSSLVPGDLLELEAGDNVPADARLVWVTPNFSVQEASLTGESSPVMKTTLELDEKDIPLADRANMVYAGTSVAGGKARALVTETGMATELGKIAGMIQEIAQEPTPLQKKLEEFGRWIVYLCLGLVALVFLLEYLRGGSLIDVFLTAVSLAVAAIPEGLPAIVTIALALGVHRMVKRNALIRKLPSVETLGCATVICSDKTGTLTKNEMTVQTVFADDAMFAVTGIGYEPKGQILLSGKALKASDHPDLARCLSCGVLCNGSELEEKDGAYRIIGDPTEAAILTAAAKIGLLKKDLEKEAAFVEEIPFDPDRKKMTVIRREAARVTAFVKGAPDVLLKDCVKIRQNGTTRDLTDGDREKIIRANEELAGKAMRVLAVAYRHMDKVPADLDAKFVEKELVFSGLIAMIDPPREEAEEAVAKCAQAGIKTVMITGDHKNTAVAIAQRLGIFTDRSVALTGEELDRLGEKAFEDKVELVNVYARVSPEHKLRIVRAWRKKGQVVAMTGDGVNDAPAIKEADIGVAMGVTGTDVTKEVSDMVITDDNFASIVAAVEEGRGIYDNIKKFIHYLLSCNAGEILVMFTASLAALPPPLLPIHILWVNLVTDGLPALALGVDPVDPRIMQYAPRRSGEAVITGKKAVLMLLQGAFIAFCSLLAFTLVLFIESEGLARARTAAFIVLSCSQLFHSFNCRSMTESIFKLGIFTNKKLVAANLISFFLQVSVVYIPFFQKIFKTENLGMFDWMLVITISSFPLWAMEAVKLIGRRTGFRISA